MPEKKIVGVCGATGRQGGSVARTLLSNGTYHVRALTRDPTKPAAQELAKLGAEVVKADQRDKDAVRRAFEGAYAVFAVTDYWAQNVSAWGETDETEIGVLLADAASDAGVKHYVFSTLPSPLARSGGKYDKIEHWETKALVSNYIASKLPNLPTTSVFLGAYYDLLASPFPFYSPSTNTVSFPLPASTVLPMVWADRDAGPIVSAILSDPSTTVGKTYAIYRRVALKDAIAGIEKATGTKIEYKQMSRQEFAAQFGDGLVAHDLLGNLEYFAEYEGFGGDEIVADEGGVLLGHQLASFEEWAVKTLGAKKAV